MNSVANNMGVVLVASRHAVWEVAWLIQYGPSVYGCVEVGGVCLVFCWFKCAVSAAQRYRMVLCHFEIMHPYVGK